MVVGCGRWAPCSCSSPQPPASHAVQCAERHQELPLLSWLEREAVNLKVGSSSLPGSVHCVRCEPGAVKQYEWACHAPSAAVAAATPKSSFGQRPRHKADKASIAQAAAALSRCPQWLRSFNCSGLWQLGSLCVFLTTATLRPMSHNARGIDKSFLSSAG